MIDLSKEKKITTASEDFKKNLTTGKRYVDKTSILTSLLDIDHETTFYLRPRRFGKTLMLSMIRYFVEDTRDEALNKENQALFEGLEIMNAGEQYRYHMTSYPVIHLTFQTVKGYSYPSAVRRLKNLIRKLYGQMMYLLASAELNEQDREFFNRILKGKDPNSDEIPDEDYTDALINLSEYLRKDSGMRTVVLIDEYDVPLENASRNGYYREMVGIIGPLLQNVLKSNSENLQFAVVTGCLRIAKEGIYTGLNNPKVNTVLSPGKNDLFGFTEEEVKNLLTDSGLGNHFEEVQAWYDGYRFGDSIIYNPWSVINYIEDLNSSLNSEPKGYWANTSENAIIRELAERATDESREKIERVMNGEEISFTLRDNIVYDELYKKQDNVFNVLLAAGYLTAARIEGKTVYTRIPNQEIQKVFQEQISDWFNASLDYFDVHGLYTALEHGNTEQLRKILTDEFLSSMSYYDSVEAFYHGVLLTLMQLNKDYICDSNREIGNGRFDIQAKQKRDWDLGFVLEVKISDSAENLLHDAKAGADQIEKNESVKQLQREGYRTIMTYGISLYQKRCRVV